MRWNMRSIVQSVLVIGVVTMTGCSPVTVTRVDVQSFEMQKAGQTTTKMFSALTTVFVNRGFDVKMSNTDAGVITTEYKKFASMGTEPPFDYYMQIRGHLVEQGGAMKVSLSPFVKEQNRLNAAAYTERELSYYTGAPETVKLLKPMTPGVGWQALGQVLFMNVVQDTASSLGIRIEEVQQNVTQTPEKFMMIGNEVIK